MKMPDSESGLGTVGHCLQLLRLASWSVLLAVEVSPQSGALGLAKAEMDSFTRQTFLTKGKM